MHAERCSACDASIGSGSHYVLAQASSIDASDVGREPQYLCRQCGTAMMAMVRMQRLRAAGNGGARHAGTQRASTSRSLLSRPLDAGRLRAARRQTARVGLPGLLR